MISSFAVAAIMLFNPISLGVIGYSIYSCISIYSENKYGSKK